MRQFALMGCVVLAGCGGSGGDVVSRSDQAAQLANDVLSDGISDPGRLPNRGAASYSGFMNAKLPVGRGGNSISYLGDLTLDVDFAANRNEVTGTARKFTSSGGGQLDGRLKISSGDLFRGVDPDDDYSFTGDVDGTLTRKDTSYVVAAEIEGEFRGRNQRGVSGILFGDITGPNGQDIFDGDFVASRD